MARRKSIDDIARQRDSISYEMMRMGYPSERIDRMNETAVRYMNNIRNSSGKLATRGRELIARDDSIRRSGNWGFIGDDTVEFFQGKEYGGGFNGRKYSRSTYMGNAKG